MYCKIVPLLGNTTGNWTMARGLLDRISTCKVLPTDLQCKAEFHSRSDPSRKQTDVRSLVRDHDVVELQVTI